MPGIRGMPRMLLMPGMPAKHPLSRMSITIEMPGIRGMRGMT